MPPRGRYTKISLTDRQRIVEAYNAGSDWKTLADHLNIKFKTAESIIRKFISKNEIAPRPRGGARNMKVSNTMKNELMNIVHDHPEYTLTQMNAELRNRNADAPNISDSTVAHVIEGMSITTKKLKDVNQEWDRDRVLTERQQYVEWYHEVGANTRLVYIDETGFNVYTRRTRGRAPRGRPAVRRVASQRGRNVTACLAISNTHGLIHFNFSTGGFTQLKFAAFLGDLTNKLRNLFGNDQVIILLDNVRSHHNVPLPHPDIYSFHFLPTYSPTLNPVEEANSVFKARLKRLLAENQHIFFRENIAEAAQNQRVTMEQQRTQLLMEYGEQALEGSLTAQKCTAFCHHTLRHFTAIMRRQPLDGDDVFEEIWHGLPEQYDAEL